jgi:LysM repeat protein
MNRLILAGLLLPVLVACGKDEPPPQPAPVARPAPPPPAPAPAPAPAPEPAPAPSPEPAPAPAPAPEPKPAPAPPKAAAASKPAKAPATGTHTVAKGETVYSIATRYKLDVVDLGKWNGLADLTRIREGQVLRLTAPESVAKPAPGATYTVAKGDTLFSIARKNGLKVEELARLNGLADPTQIRVGQQLKLGEAGK